MVHKFKNQIALVSPDRIVYRYNLRWPTVGPLGFCIVDQLLLCTRQHTSNNLIYSGPFGYVINPSFALEGDTRLGRQVGARQQHLQQNRHRPPRVLHLGMLVTLEH